MSVSTFSRFRRQALATLVLALIGLRLMGVAWADALAPAPNDPKPVEASASGLPGSLSSCEGQIKCLGGLILLDGLTETTGVTKQNKYMDLVEVSTPSVPSANHAILWLNTEGGAGKQALKIQFDDGTVVSLGGN